MYIVFYTLYLDKFVLEDDALISQVSFIRTKHLCVLIFTIIRVMLVPLNMFRSSSNFFIYRSKAALLLWIIFDICVSCWSFVMMFCLFLAAL